MMPRFNIVKYASLSLAFCVAAFGLTGAVAAETTPPNRYVPIEGGWRLHIDGKDQAKPEPALTELGQVKDNPRVHRRLLFPPADKSLVWSKEQRGKLQRCAFRPLVVAYMAPRFLLDLHSGGGLMGHVYLGIVNEKSGESAWLHDWADVNVAYADGVMEYCVRDPRFPSLVVHVAATPMADAAGVLLKFRVEGDCDGLSLVWSYGGASAFLTNYNMGAAEFTFAPEQCAKDYLQWKDHTFSLRRPFDENDVYKKEVYAAARYLDGWEAEIQGGSTSDRDCGYGLPAAMSASPLEVCSSAQWAGGRVASELKNVVAVQRISLNRTSRDGIIAVGMGFHMRDILRDPGAAWKAAIKRNASIASRVAVETPDSYLNAAVPMMAFATEGTWGDSAILHGAWSWRYAYLGWRGWYGSDCYGWTDRVRRSIESHTTLGLVQGGDDQGALGSLLEYNPGVFYNMNEVFLDQTRHYFEYTNDLELMREIFPILKGIVAWEDRRLQPEAKGLYENALNTWISDSHWYIGGQCTQASAYMLRAYSFLARLAPLIGEDAAPFTAQADRIRTAMQSELWMADKGVFAEYRDTRGERMLHPEPELPTIYHAAEFGAASPEQIARMLQWADRSLRHESTPGGGRLVWSSNWYPNRGRSYTHSTYEMAYAEEFNYALTNFMAGRADDGYAIIRAALSGIFNGPTPGGLACHTYVDGTQRANDEFADAISMWGRCVVEGLFGIAPDRPSGVVNLSPQFPSGWEHASIETPHFSYRWQLDGKTIRIRWKSPVSTRVAVRLPITGDRIVRAVSNGKPIEHSIGRGYLGVNWALIETDPGRRGDVEVEYDGNPPTVIEPLSLPPSASTPPTWTPNALHNDGAITWSALDLSSIFNSNLTEASQKLFDSAIPPAMPASQVGFGYWREHLTQYHGSRNQPVSDAAWRAKVDKDGRAMTTEGIPFISPKEGPNIAMVSRTGGFPESITFPVQAAGKTLYLMVSGVTFPAQSHVPNIRVTLTYADGEEVTRDLVNPTDIGDCWSTWCGRYHDTAANGFENLGGRTGPAGSSEVQDMTQPIALDTEAHLVAFSLRPDVALASVTFKAVANDIAFGVMGATVASDK
ncbi:MAG: DUF4450 domain-containing protein [Candidatus Hydrogenedentes bacterium]|nr:DUF4450 domain-containing protein [Candidatus Hydrogenedentota bacterium]